jgi:hypothetical protein
MEEEAAARENGALRPFSTQTMPSRFPSLRRLTTAEPYRHRSLPADAPSPSSDRPSSEITFAVLYDDGPDYHLGHFDDGGSIRSGRPASSQSFAPSFRTRDSRITSDDHDHLQHPDFVANQRLLAEGYLNANDSQQQFDPYHGNSQETLAMNNLRNLDAEKGQNPFMGTPNTDNPSETWCDCEEDRDSMRDVKDPSKFGNIGNIDLEAQHGPVPPTPTPLMEKEDPDAYIVCTLTWLFIE